MKIKLSSFLQWCMNLYAYQTLGWQFALLYIDESGSASDESGPKR